MEKKHWRAIQAKTETDIMSIVANTEAAGWSKTAEKIAEHCEAAFEQGKLSLRSQLVECEKVAEALKSRLDENSNGDLADYDAFDMYEAYKSAHPTEKG